MKLMQYKTTSDQDMMDFAKKLSYKNLSSMHFTRLPHNVKTNPIKPRGKTFAAWQSHSQEQNDTLTEGQTSLLSL